MFIRFRKKAQSVFEYTVLAIVVSTALVAMSKYIQRSMNARLKLIQLELNEGKR